MESTDCPVCGNSCGQAVLLAHDNLLGHPGTFRVVRCPVCSLLYLNPRPTLAHIASYYDGRYAPYLKKPKPLRRRSGLLKWLRSILYRNSDLRTCIKKNALGIPAGKILDVGCGAGALLHRMRELGWDANGIEIDPGAAQAARRLGLDVRTGTLKNASFPDNHFDLVTAVHVLEHVHRPVEFLNELWRVLKPGGLLFVEVPNALSFNYRVFRSEWFHLDAPRHLCSYSPRPLRYLLRSTGFRMRKLCFSSGTTGLRGSINYSRRVRGLKEYGWINKKAVKRMLGLFTFALDIARRGDVIRVEAVKEGNLR